MSGIRFQPSKFAESEVARTLELPPASAATFKRGAVVELNASGEVVLHALDGSVPYGVALNSATAGVSDSPSGNVVVALANSSSEFMGQLVDAGADVIAAPSGVVDIGDIYGIEAVDGVHFVDSANVATTMVTITGYDDDISVVFFRFTLVDDLS